MPCVVGPLLAVLWSQVRVVRYFVLISANGVTPLTWSKQRPIGAIGLALHLAVIALPCEKLTTQLFVVACVASLASLYQGLPYDVDNGGVFEILVLINLCAGFAAGGDLDVYLAAVRVVFVSVYIFAALAKLNRGYFSIDCSCSTAFSFIFMEVLLPTCAVKRLTTKSIRVTLRTIHVLVVLAEIAIPCLVLSDYVRCGVWLDLLFHLILGVFAYDFSLVAIACLPAFMQSGFYCELAHLTTDFTARCVAVIIALLTLASLQRSPHQGVKFGLAHGSFLLIFVGLSVVLYHARGGYVSASFADVFWPDTNSVAPTAIASVMLAILNGTAPYLGLKTHTTWTMFSNLQVEGGQTNHLFIPSWQPFPFLRDVVTVLDTDLAPVRNFHNVAAFKCKAALHAIAEEEQYETSIHGNSPIGTHGGEAGVLPFCVPYSQLRALVSHAIADEPSFFVEYVRSQYGDLGKRREGLISGERQKLVVLQGQVVDGDENLLKASFCCRRFGFSRSWLPDRRPVCCH